jgi:FKBP-type peptidyl-prolyl cis-trans isomerase FkpA
MWKCSEFFSFISTLVLLSCFSCQPDQKQLYTRYSWNCYYRLISFQPDKRQKEKKEFIQLTLSFSTQNDSVFWDSFNNFNDLYVVSVDAPDTANVVNVWARKSALKDSFELLIPCSYFFKTQFNQHRIPEFSRSDSVVKVQVKTEHFLSAQEYRKLSNELEKRELDLIRNFFTNEAEFKLAKDSMGYYWVQRPTPWSPPADFSDFDRLMVDYEGRFLSGRVFEKSASDFEMIYGIPDQMVKGLNYVMGQLNEGQTAKIILPSALAFGEKGSSNGTVPPYTPVLYNIKLTEVKRK